MKLRLFVHFQVYINYLTLKLGQYEKSEYGYNKSGNSLLILSCTQFVYNGRIVKEQKLSQSNVGCAASLSEAVTLTIVLLIFFKSMTQ